MQARTASLLTNLLCGVLLYPAQASEPAVPPTALCPATMHGDADRRFALSNLYIIRFEVGKGSQNLPFTGDRARAVWTLPKAANVTYRAACEYGEEIIGVAIPASFGRCWLERKKSANAATEEVTTWCS